MSVPAESGSAAQVEQVSASDAIRARAGARNNIRNRRPDSLLRRRTLNTLHSAESDRSLAAFVISRSSSSRGSHPEGQSFVAAIARPGQRHQGYPRLPYCSLQQSSDDVQPHAGSVSGDKCDGARRRREDSPAATGRPEWGSMATPLDSGKSTFASTSISVYGRNRRCGPPPRACPGA